MSRLLRTVWRILGSSQLAVILLTILLLASLLASLFPQMPEPLPARPGESPDASELWLASVRMRYRSVADTIHRLGLFDAYHAPWYLALLAALLLNNLACSVQRLRRLWHSLTRSPIVIRPGAFYEGFADRAEWPVPSLRAGCTAAKTALARRRYRTYVESDRQETHVSMYAERGRWGQTATLVGHWAAIALVLAVSARPALSWSETAVNLLPGQAYPISHRDDLAIRAGSLTIDRHPGGQPRDYLVPLTVLLDGSPIVTRTTGTNHPLNYRGTMVHLQGYGPAVFISTSEGDFDLAFEAGPNRELSLPEAGLSLRITYEPQRDTATRESFQGEDAETTELFVELLSGDDRTLDSGWVSDGQQIQLDSTSIRFKTGHFTSWQIGSDPTFGLAVTAAGLFLAATLVALWWPYRRIWLRIDAQKAQMVGAGDLADGFGSLAAEISGGAWPKAGANG